MYIYIYPPRSPPFAGLRHNVNVKGLVFVVVPMRNGLLDPLGRKMIRFHRFRDTIFSDKAICAMVKHGII